MKTETDQRDMQMEALIWKVTLQEPEKLLQCIQNKLYKAKLDLYAIDKDEVLERFYNSAKYYSGRIEKLQQRISHFENKLYLINEYNTSQCDVEVFDEAEAIFIGVKNCNKNVKVLFSEISFCTGSKNPY